MSYLKAGLGLFILGTLFYFPVVSKADETAVADPVVDGVILNSDGTPYTKRECVRFVPVGEYEQTSKDFFMLCTQAFYGTNLVNGFSSKDYIIGYTVQPIKKRIYRAYILLQPDVDITKTNPTAQELAPTEQIVDLRDQTVSQHLTFQLINPNKFIHGTVSDQDGNPVASTSNSDMIYVMTLKDGTSGYSSVQLVTTPDTTGRYRLALSDQGGKFFIGAQGTERTKYLHSFGYQTNAVFANDTSAEDFEYNLVVNRVGTSTVTGRVLEHNGKPVDDYSAVYAYDTTDINRGNYSQTNPTDGRFSVKVRAGSYTISVNRWFENKNNNIIAYEQYPTISVDLIDGQTIDVGDIRPTRKALILSTDSGTPAVLLNNENGRWVDDKGQVINGFFDELFDSTKYFDARRSSGVVWKDGKVSLSNVSAAGYKASSATPAIAQGVITSKPVTPRNVRVSSVLLTDTRDSTGFGSVQYALSPNGSIWATITPGKRFTIPSDWDTRGGLRWRATMQTSSTESAISLTGLRLSYTAKPNNPKPAITKTTVTKSGGKTTLTVFGKNLSRWPVVYLGGKKVPAVNKNGKLLVPIDLKQFSQSKYKLTVVNPDLQFAKGPTVKLR